MSRSVKAFLYWVFSSRITSITSFFLPISVLVAKLSLRPFGCQLKEQNHVVHPNLTCVW